MRSIFRRRKLRICYYEADKILLNREKINLEFHLKQLPTFTRVELQSLDSPAFHPCDLLVISALHLPEEDFDSWIKSLYANIAKQGIISSPAVILAEVSFAAMTRIIDWAIDINWYFDVVTPEHMSSLAIRITNLLRIHDHLHELTRYAAELASLQKRVDDVEKIFKTTLQEST